MYSGPALQYIQISTQQKYPNLESKKYPNLESNLSPKDPGTSKVQILALLVAMTVELGITVAG